MSERRMFAKTIIDSDAFLEMPLTTQALYFHLSMRADDDGFINNPKRIQRTIGCSEDDLKLLVVKNFIIPFESGIVVIKHWKIHNYIRGDRKKSTVYPEEFKLLDVKENGAYTMKETADLLGDSQMSGNCQSSDSQMSGNCPHRLVEVSIGEYSIVEDNNISPSATPKSKPTKHKYGEYKNVLLSDDEYSKLKERFPSDYEDRIEALSFGIKLKGYKYKSHYLAILKWAKNEFKKTTESTKSSNMFLDMLKEGE